jgi:hypothetical protein
LEQKFNVDKSIFLPYCSKKHQVASKKQLTALFELKNEG